MIDPQPLASRGFDDSKWITYLGRPVNWWKQQETLSINNNVTLEAYFHLIKRCIFICSFISSYSFLSIWFHMTRLSGSSKCVIAFGIFQLILPKSFLSIPEFPIADLSIFSLDHPYSGGEWVYQGTTFLHFYPIWLVYWGITFPYTYERAWKR